MVKRLVASNQVGLRLSKEAGSLRISAGRAKSLLEAPSLWLMTEALEKVERPATHDFVDIEELHVVLLGRRVQALGFEMGGRLALTVTMWSVSGSEMRMA